MRGTARGEEGGVLVACGLAVVAFFLVVPAALQVAVLPVVDVAGAAASQAGADRLARDPDDDTAATDRGRDVARVLGGRFVDQVDARVQVEDGWAGSVVRVRAHRFVPRDVWLTNETWIPVEGFRADSDADGER